jgi:hypothetical protein
VQHQKLLHFVGEGKWSDGIASGAVLMYASYGANSTLSASIGALALSDEMLGMRPGSPFAGAIGRGNINGLCARIRPL